MGHHLWSYRLINMNEIQKNELLNLLDKYKDRQVSIIIKRGLLASIYKDKLYIKVSDCNNCGECCIDKYSQFIDENKNSCRYLNDKKHCEIYHTRPYICLLFPNPLCDNSIDKCNVRFKVI